ncbi:hypothetical protein CDAR_251021 [Caerostris darwini]|uniref:Uncharacterized protein n=1 Tax=Caerostris darwini TaxID=1538125 RepID=A0AAV4TJE8_9ARAC|nr:hypothetical protein CDAR_251021 [Caerostris darwini]
MGEKKKDRIQPKRLLTVRWEGEGRKLEENRYYITLATNACGDPKARNHRWYFWNEQVQQVFHRWGGSEQEKNATCASVARESISLSLCHCSIIKNGALRALAGASCAVLSLLSNHNFRARATGKLENRFHSFFCLSGRTHGVRQCDGQEKGVMFYVSFFFFWFCMANRALIGHSPIADDFVKVFGMSEQNLLHRCF